jgi:hypothetical protein
MSTHYEHHARRGDHPSRMISDSSAVTSSTAASATGAAEEPEDGGDSEADREEPLEHWPARGAE